MCILICVTATRLSGAETANQILQKGTELFQQRQLDEARREFLRLAQVEPGELKARYYLGRISLLESKPRDAIRWLEPIILSDPPVLDAAAQLSKAYMDAGEMPQAKAMTERALKTAEWDGALHYRLGRIYQQMGDAERAGTEFGESVRLKVADRESVQKLVECSQVLARGDLAAALKIREQMLGNSALDPDVLVALGLTFTGAGKQKESVELFQAAALRDPNFPQAQFNAGVALIRLGRNADATPYLKAAQRLMPESAGANSALGLAYVVQAKYAESLQPLLEWQRLEPNNSRALNMLGLAYLRTNAAAQAIPVLRKSAGLSSGDPKPYFLLVEALNAAEQQTAALETSDQAVKLFPLLPQAQLAKAQQLARLGRYREAGPVFQQALELAPEQIECLLGLAEVEQKQGDYAASLEAYDRVLSLESGNLSALVGRARDLVFLKRLPEARAVLEEAAGRHPENSQLHFELSRVYARLGEGQLAAEQTKKLQELRANEAKLQ